jgi:predicted DCC family thiol-disulfide oxidoreductase YuxK
MQSMVRIGPVRIEMDRRNQFSFASLQSEAGQQLLGHFFKRKKVFIHFFLIEEGNLYTKSTAPLKVLKSMADGWSLLYILVIIPKFIRDGVYGLVANNRYRWFARTNECWLPDDRLRSRFLE